MEKILELKKNHLNFVTWKSGVGSPIISKNYINLEINCILSIVILLH